MPRTELYIGNLGRDVSRKDIESVFDKYGRLLRCDIKNKGYGSVYAFLEFEEERDAEVNTAKKYCFSKYRLTFAFIFIFIIYQYSLYYVFLFIFSFKKLKFLIGTLNYMKKNI